MKVKKFNEDDFNLKYTMCNKFKSENFDWEDGDIGRFETFGKDLEVILKINKINPKTIWTAIDTDSGLVFRAGFHIVNRIYYLVTNEKWSNSDEEYLIEEYREIVEDKSFKLTNNLLGMDSFKIGSKFDCDAVFRVYGYSSNHPLAKIKLESNLYKLEVDLSTIGEHSKPYLEKETPYSKKMFSLLESYILKNKLTNHKLLNIFANNYKHSFIRFSNNCWIEGEIKLIDKNSNTVILNNYESNLGIDGVYSSLKEAMEFYFNNCDKMMNYYINYI